MTITSHELFPMHVPSPSVWEAFEKSWACLFGKIALVEFVLKNPCQQLCTLNVAPSQRSSHRAICQAFPVRTHCMLAFSQRSFPTFQRFPVRSRCFVAPSQQSSPGAISHGVLSVQTSVSLPRRSKLNDNTSIRDAFGKMSQAPWSRDARLGEVEHCES